MSASVTRRSSSARRSARLGPSEARTQPAIAASHARSRSPGAAGADHEPVVGDRAARFAAQLLLHALDDAREDRGPAVGGPRLRLTIERGRPPVEQLGAVARRSASTPRPSAVSNTSAAGAERLAEIQRLAQADQQVELIARRQRGEADAGERGRAPPPGRRRIPGRCGPKPLEVRAGEDQRGGIRRLRIARAPRTRRQSRRRSCRRCTGRGPAPARPARRRPAAHGSSQNHQHDREAESSSES